MTTTLAIVSGYSVGQLAVAIVIISAVVALALEALHQFGIAIPAWVQHCFWILIVAVVVIACIRLVLTL